MQNGEVFHDSLYNLFSSLFSCSLGQYAPFLPLNTGTTADASKLARVDAQSPNSASQPQNAHSAAQQPMFNFHYGYYYPSMFPGGVQYPMFPVSHFSLWKFHTMQSHFYWQICFWIIDKTRDVYFHLTLTLYSQIRSKTKKSRTSVHAAQGKTLHS